MINQSTKEFVDLVGQHVPNVWATAYPRRVLPPNGYTNPKYYSASLAGCCLMWRHHELTMLPHTVCALTGLIQAQVGVQTYFVRNEFAMAVANTKLPMDFKLSEVKWPLEAMVFVLPDAFCQSLFGCHVPFLAITRCQEGTYPRPSDYAWAMKHNWEVEKFVPIYVERERMMFHYPCFRRNELPCDYSATWPTDLDLTSIQNGDFTDATVWERIVNGLPPSTEDLNPAQEKELQDKMSLFGIKLMLAFTARPHVIKTGGVQRKAQYRRGVKWLDELWHPNTVGWDYVLQRNPANAGTGASHGSYLRTQWVPGHFTHQFIGKRNDPNFVPVSKLPRKPVEGTIDWSQVSKEVQDAFWRNHRLDWIDPIPPSLLMTSK